MCVCMYIYIYEPSLILRSRFSWRTSASLRSLPGPSLRLDASSSLLRPGMSLLRPGMSLCQLCESPLPRVYDCQYSLSLSLSLSLSHTHNTHSHTRVRMQACHMHTKHTNTMSTSTHMHTYTYSTGNQPRSCQTPNTHIHIHRPTYMQTHQHTYTHTHTAPGINPAHYVRPLRCFSLRAIQLLRAIITALSTKKKSEVSTLPYIDIVTALSTDSQKPVPYYT